MSQSALLRQGASIGLALAMSATGVGCKSTMHTSMGDVMASYSAEHAVPFIMQMDDTKMACATGISFASFLLSFGRVTDEPERAGLVTMLSAAFCAEAEAREAELAQLRALHEGRAGEASDARVVEKRAHALAARRFSEAYRLHGALFASGTCANLEPDDEIFFLLGLASGLLAVMHDRGADGQVGVPTDVPIAVARASECLDSAKWWGVPSAMRAVVWAVVPGTVPQGQDPWTVLLQTAAQGKEAGVRLAQAFRAQALVAVGRDDELQETLREHAASLAIRPADSRWRLVDEIATLIILHESDKLWTREVGYRTPFGGLGTFPMPTPSAIDNDLLEGLE